MVQQVVCDLVRITQCYHTHAIESDTVLQVISYLSTTVSKLVVAFLIFLTSLLFAMDLSLNMVTELDVDITLHPRDPFIHFSPATHSFLSVSSRVPLLPLPTSALFILARTPDNVKVLSTIPSTSFPHVVRLAVLACEHMYLTST